MSYGLEEGKRADTDSAVMAALLCSVWLFHSFIVPVRDARHLIPAIPALLGLSASALAAFAGSMTAMTPASRNGSCWPLAPSRSRHSSLRSVGDRRAWHGRRGCGATDPLTNGRVRYSADLFGKLRRGCVHRRGCRTGATARPSPLAGEPDPVELELGSDRTTASCTTARPMPTRI